MALQNRPIGTDPRGGLDGSLRPSASTAGVSTGLSPSAESLGEGASLEPLGTLAYLETKSEFACSPHFELPVPSVGLTPRLAAYALPTKLDERLNARKEQPSFGCGEEGSVLPHEGTAKGGEGALSLCALDAAFVQQHLTVFDAAGLMPNLINPLGYPSLLIDSSSPAESLRSRLEALPPEDLALVIEVLPEVPEAMRRALKASLAKTTVSPPSASATLTLSSLAGASLQTENPKLHSASEAEGSRRGDSAATTLRHPSKPHLKAKRILQVKPHPYAGRVRLEHISLDLVPEEAREFCTPLPKQAASEVDGSHHDAKTTAPASLLVPEEDASLDSRTLSLYVHSASSLKEKTEQSEEAQSSSRDPSNASYYKFRRDYVLQPSPSPSGGAERSVVFLVPPFQETVEGQEEPTCFLLPLPGPRRVLLKAGGMQKKPSLCVEWKGAEASTTLSSPVLDSEPSFYLSPPAFSRKRTIAKSEESRPAPRTSERRNGLELFEGEDNEAVKETSTSFHGTKKEGRPSVYATESHH